MSDRLKILLCSHNPLKRELGAPKVLIELGEELVKLNWQVEYVSVNDLGMEHTTGLTNQQLFAERLHVYLKTHASNFDVVDYEHEYLPYPRADFPPRTLMVARSVLLIHHFETLLFRGPPGVREFIRSVVRSRPRRIIRDARVANGTRTLQEADLINVSNDDDKAELIRRSINSDRIVVIPFGMTSLRRLAFESCSGSIADPPVIAFVGTFDHRKGARDFPEIVRQVRKQIPNARFRLLGTEGHIRTAEQVRNKFSLADQNALEIYTTFAADELPKLLSDCSLGLFPSHIEGFGFAVLEMLAASLPVIAYDAPGPPMMLPRDWLIERGNTSALAAKLVSLLNNKQQLQAARQQACLIPPHFTWELAAKMTDQAYRSAVEERRAILS